MSGPSGVSEAGNVVLKMASNSPASSGAADARSPSVTDSKRKAEPNGAAQRKRSRYISLACNECKRRKIRCSGEVPCQRCGHLSLECLYAPNCCNSNFKNSQEFRSVQDHIDHLQSQVDTLFSNLNELYQKTQAPGAAAAQSSSQISLAATPQSSEPQRAPLARQRSKPPRFHGPTSSAFNFDVAKSSLQTMGIAPNDDAAQDLFATQDPTPTVTPPRPLTTSPQLLTDPGKDPLSTIRREDALRLCRVFEDEIGLMYPFVDMEKLMQQANLLFNSLDSASRPGFPQRAKPGPDFPSDDDVNILKLILAITLIVEGDGQSVLGAKLFSSVKASVEMNIWDSVDIKTITIFALVATYYFQTDEDIIAYRMIGLAARMCLEMGLHRRDALMKAFHTEQERRDAIRVFWSVYSLDRRWSFGTGLPFVIQDQDVDRCLPEPDDSAQYLKQMVYHGRLCSKVWYSGLGSESTATIKRDQIEFLDYQVLQWRKNIPEQMKFYTIDAPQDPEPVSRGLRRLRFLLYIRGNHLRILIYRPVLHSATSIAENMPYAQRVVDIAKDTIRLLTRLNQTSDIYRSQQILFNYFLVAALAVLLLAVSHAPIHFNNQVRDEFYLALDLIKDFSTRSYVSKRLWKMIRGLRQIGQKLGLFPRGILTEPSDTRSTAAVAMASLAGHPLETLTAIRMHPLGELGNSPTNGLQITNELTNLFEAVGGHGGVFHHSSSSEGISGCLIPAEQLPSTSEGMATTLGNEGELARFFQELF